MKPRILLINLILLSSICYSFNKLSLSFVRTVDTGEGRDISKGTIYYDYKKAILKITEPVLQWMILSMNQTIIFYPEEKHLLTIKSKSPTMLPFFQSFIGIIESDFGLSKIGYKLDDTEFKGDTLFTYWILPEKYKGIQSKYILSFLNDKIIGLKLFNNQNVIIKSQFGDHYPYGGFYFPLKVNIIYYNKEDGPVMEKIIYTKPVFDKPFPEEIVNFKIPENIKRKEIEW